MNGQVRWTAKLPAIILGVASLLGAGVATRNGRVIAGVVLILLAAAFVIYSFTIKEWCELHNYAWKNTWGDLSFNGTLGECIRSKSWFSF
jgi:hypothetical protein